MTTDIEHAIHHDPLTNKFGPLMTERQLAESMHRTVGGLRWSLQNTTGDQVVDAINQSRVRIGRRVYYRSAIISRVLCLS